MESIQKIEVHDALIPEALLDEVLKLVKSRGFQYGWKSDKSMTFSHWNLGFSKRGSSSENREDITDELPDEIRRVWEYIQPLVFEDTPVLLRAYCNAHTYGTEGYIHRDSEFEDDLTAVIYLNKTWKGNWAGETLIFENGEIVKAVIPKWNRIFMFPANVKHVARGVSRFCPEARTVLVFKATKLEMQYES